MIKYLPIILLIGCTYVPHKYKAGDRVIVGDTVPAVVLRCWNDYPHVRCKVMFNNGTIYNFDQDNLSDDHDTLDQGE